MRASAKRGPKGTHANPVPAVVVQIDKRAPTFPSPRESAAVQGGGAAGRCGRGALGGSRGSCGDSSRSCPQTCGSFSGTKTLARFCAHVPMRSARSVPLRQSMLRVHDGQCNAQCGMLQSVRDSSERRGTEAGTDSARRGVTLLPLEYSAVLDLVTAERRQVY